MPVRSLLGDTGFAQKPFFTDKLMRKHTTKSTSTLKFHTKP